MKKRITMFLGLAAVILFPIFAVADPPPLFDSTQMAYANADLTNRV